MTKIALFGLTALLLMAVKCPEDTVEPGLLDLTMQPVFDGKPFIMNKVYNIGGKNVKFSRLAFFVSGIGLTNGQNTVVEAESPLFFELDGLDDSTKAAAGVTQRLVNLPLDAYKAITLGFGLDSARNAGNPSQFKSSHPLGNPDYYWAAWNSYIFAKLEGVIDRDGDGRYETGITLHTGGNSCYKPKTLNRAFDVNTSVTNIPIVLNVNTLINDIDLSTVNSTHSTGDLPTMEKLMTNLAAASSLRL